MTDTPEVLDRKDIFSYDQRQPSGNLPPSTSLTDDHTTPTFISMEAGKWQPIKGHGLSFACLFVFSVVLYFRPYELIPALSSFKTMAFWVGIITLAVFFVSQIVIEGNLTARPKEVNMVLLFGLAALVSIPFAVDPAEAWGAFADV